MFVDWFASDPGGVNFCCMYTYGRKRRSGSLALSSGVMSLLLWCMSGWLLLGGWGRDGGMVSLGVFVGSLALGSTVVLCWSVGGGSESRRVGGGPGLMPVQSPVPVVGRSRGSFSAMMCFLIAACIPGALLVGCVVMVLVGYPRELVGMNTSIVEWVRLSPSQESSAIFAGAIFGAFPFLILCGVAFAVRPRRD